MEMGKGPFLESKVVAAESGTHNHGQDRRNGGNFASVAENRGFQVPT